MTELFLMDMTFPFPNFFKSVYENGHFDKNTNMPKVNDQLSNIEIIHKDMEATLSLNLMISILSLSRITYNH